MATPRRSARVAGLDSSPAYADPPSGAKGTKRKNDASGTSPSAKRGRKSSQADQKEQKTLEETMDLDTVEPEQPNNGQNGDTQETLANTTDPAPAQPNGSSDASKNKDEHVTEKPNAPELSRDEPEPEAETEATEETKAKEPESSAEAKPSEEVSSQDQHKTKSEDQLQDPPQPKPEDKQGSAPADAQPDTETKTQESNATQQPTTNGSAVEAHNRDDDVPSSILEKGIIYFFFRPRVNIENPQDIADIQRSYIILRPLPHGAKLGDGPIGDDNNCRLIAVPKKVLPQSTKDKFMAFVESSQKSFAELRETFLTSSEYATKTAGTSHLEPPTPLAEGVYAITTTGRDSHLAYMITIPSSLGEVQNDVGVKSQGSFVVSAKNPKHPGPANAQLAGNPGFSKEIMDEFRDLRWMPLQPKLLDYANAQFLLIGESGGLDGATEQLPRDQKKDIETPKEELEKLEGEDEIRVKHLKNDDAVFADLGVSKKDYPGLATTW